MWSQFNYKYMQNKQFKYCNLTFWDCVMSYAKYFWVSINYPKEKRISREIIFSNIRGGATNYVDMQGGGGLPNVNATT